MNKTVEIIVSPSGEISIDAVGFKGPDCQTATRYLEEALGVIAQKVKKPEFQQRNIAKHQQRIGG